MSRYVLTFTKKGFIKYTSHLDMLRLFKRSFKKTDIHLAYSQGFNPHPKMAFAQPLSLGYESIAEQLEFETKVPVDAKIIMEKIGGAMPEGIQITECVELKAEGKTLAAKTVSADYLITIPLENTFSGDLDALTKAYLSQDKIIAMKRQKKTKQEAPTDIKKMIRNMEIALVDDNKIIVNIKVDSGSNSNLSPELVIQTLLDFSGIETPREEIDVIRTKIYFGK